MPPRGGPRYIAAAEPQRPLYQGDLLDGVPVLATPPNQSKWILLIPSPQGTVTREDALGGKRPHAFHPRSEDAVPDAWAHSSSEVVVAKASKTPVILVTQTCDVDHRNHYQVAPLKKVAALGSPRKVESVRNEEVGYLYYLPARPPGLAEDYYADLTLIASVHKSYFQSARVLCRLHNAERSRFQQALANFHGSPFGFNAKETASETGTYACVSCFHAGVLVTKQVDRGEHFQTCERCGDDALWLMVNG